MPTPPRPIRFAGTVDSLREGGVTLRAFSTALHAVGCDPEVSEAAARLLAEGRLAEGVMLVGDGPTRLLYLRDASAPDEPPPEVRRRREEWERYDNA